MLTYPFKWHFCVYNYIWITPLSQLVARDAIYYRTISSVYLPNYHDFPYKLGRMIMWTCDKFVSDRMINTVDVCTHTPFWNIQSTYTKESASCIPFWHTQSTYTIADDSCVPFWHTQSTDSKEDASCVENIFHTCNYIKRCHNKSSYFKSFF